MAKVAHSSTNLRGTISRVVFEGAMLHFFAQISPMTLFRVDVSGMERLELLNQDESNTVRLSFSEVNLIPKDS